MDIRAYPWRGYLVNQEYREYSSDIFGELGPDEETVESWYSTADKRNNSWLAQLDVIFKKDSGGAVAVAMERSEHR